MDVMIVIIVALAAGALGVGLGYTLKRKSTSDQRQLAEESAAEIRANAEAEKKAILLGAKEDAIRALAHSLKGASAQIGARGMADLCVQIDAAVRASEQSTLGHLLTALEADYATVSASLREERRRVASQVG